VRLWRKSLAVGAVAALLLGVPLLSLRAGDETITSVVYLEGTADGDRSRLVVEPLLSVDGDATDERVVFNVQHEPGFLPRGALSPDGREVALVRQPRGRPEREAAQAVLIDLDAGGALTTLSVRAFGASTPVFSTSGLRRVVFITAATMAPAPPPTDDEMRLGRLRPYDFTIWEIDRDGHGATRRVEQRLTWLHTIGIGIVRFGPRGNPVPSLLMYRVTHGGADIAALNLQVPDGPANIANLGFAMARDFDVTENGDALLFLAQDPGQATARIEALFLAQGGAPVQLGGQISTDASPAWAQSFREWFLVRRPGRLGQHDPPMRLHRASASAPAGRPMDSLTSLTGVAEGPELPLEHGISPDGRFAAVRTDSGEGPLFFLRDTRDPQSAHPLGDGGLIRVLGFR
jgi:hypothetical protein